MHCCIQAVCVSPESLHLPGICFSKLFSFLILHFQCWLHRLLTVSAAACFLVTTYLLLSFQASFMHLYLMFLAVYFASNAVTFLTYFSILPTPSSVTSSVLFFLHPPTSCIPEVDRQIQGDMFKMASKVGEPFPGLPRERPPLPLQRGPPMWHHSPTVLPAAAGRRFCRLRLQNQNAAQSIVTMGRRRGWPQRVFLLPRWCSRGVCRPGRLPTCLPL